MFSNRGPRISASTYMLGDNLIEQMMSSNVDNINWYAGESLKDTDLNVMINVDLY